MHHNCGGGSDWPVARRVPGFSEPGGVFGPARVGRIQWVEVELCVNERRGPLEGCAEHVEALVGARDSRLRGGAVAEFVFFLCCCSVLLCLLHAARVRSAAASAMVRATSAAMGVARPMLMPTSRRMNLSLMGIASITYIVGSWYGPVSLSVPTVMVSGQCAFPCACPVSANVKGPLL